MSNLITLLISEKHADVINWASTSSEEILTNTFLLGYAAYKSGLAEYYRTYYQADTLSVQILEEELKRRIDETNSNEAMYEERIVKRIKHETQTLAADCQYAQQQLARYRSEFDLAIEERVASRLLMAQAPLKSELIMQQRLVCALEEEVKRAHDDSAVYKDRCEESIREVAALGHKIADSAHDHELNRLKAEIQVLKGSNNVKGRVGEALLREVLQTSLTDWEVVSTGKTPHECDIHMINSAGEIIMVESKYKDNIAKSDMDKFTADIAHMEETKRPYIGAMFVSIKTPNIPHKGCVRLEVLNKRPVLYLGFRGEDELHQQLIHYTRVFVQYCQACADARANNTNDEIDTLFSAVNEHFQTTQLLKSQVSRLQRQHQDTARTIADMEKTTQTMVLQMEGFLRKHNRLSSSLSIVPIVVSLATTATTTALSNQVTIIDATTIGPYACNKCDTRFTNKKKLAIHVKQCTSVA